MKVSADSPDYEEHSAEQMSEGESSPPKERKGTRAGWIALLLIALILLGAFIYFFAVPQGQGITFTFPTSTTHTTKKTSTTTSLNAVAVKSATFHGDTLMMDVKNTGPAWTKSLTVAYVCSPGFARCSTYKSLSGHNLVQTFILAPKAEYLDRVPGICVVPVASCIHYHPVANFTYYYEVTFAYASGASTTVRVTAKAEDTAPFQGQNVAVQGIAYQLKTFSKNSSGLLTVDISLTDSLTAAKFTASMYAKIGKVGFTHRLLIKTEGCGGKLPANCSSGTLTLVEPFSTVRTGVGTPAYPFPYLLLVRDLTVKVQAVYFAVWIPALSN